MFNPSKYPSFFNLASNGHFPGYLGIKVTLVEENQIVGEMPIKPMMFAPNDFLHAGSLVTFADTLAGYATIAHLPEGARSFTTLELKSNFIRAAREGVLVGMGEPEHIGKTTQVWRVTVQNAQSKKKMAVFSCTQLILY